MMMVALRETHCPAGNVSDQGKLRKCFARTHRFLDHCVLSVDDLLEDMIIYCFLNNKYYIY